MHKISFNGVSAGVIDFNQVPSTLQSVSSYTQITHLKFIRKTDICKEG